jgi:hypothetical protein
VEAGYCWHHCENLSKLKDADFQQLTIKLFYRIIIPEFQSKRDQFLFCNFFDQRWNQKNDIPKDCIKGNR